LGCAPYHHAGYVRIFIPKLQKFIQNKDIKFWYTFNTDCLVSTSNNPFQSLQEDDDYDEIFFDNFTTTLHSTITNNENNVADPITEERILTSTC
jgi:hypothetical protein